MPRGTRLSVLAAALVAGLLAPAVAGAASAPLQASSEEYWQHIGYSFRPCTTIEWRPNLSQARDPATMRAILRDAIAEWNQAIGANVMTLGADTSSSADSRFDGRNVLEVITSSNTGFGGVGGPSTASSGTGDEVITEADVKIFDFDGMPLDQSVRDILQLSMVHEIGHGIGFLHTINPDSPMSYVSPPGAPMDAGSARVARHLLGAACGDRPTVRESIDLFATFARDKELDFDQVARQNLALLGSQVTDVVSAGVHLAHQRLDEPGAVRRAVICRDDAFPDCLAGSGLAGSDGLVVFVPGGAGGSLPATVRDVLRRAFGPAVGAADVIIVGGAGAVSQRVEDQLVADGFRVRRLRGVAPNADRFGTAAVIAQDVVARNGTVGTVLLARGDNPADAMTAGVVAARDGLPLVLTNPTSLPEVTRAALERWRPQRIVLLGGTAAVGTNVAKQVEAYTPRVERARGVERTATSVAIARGLLGYTAIEQTTRPLTLLNGRHPSAWALAIGYAPLGAVQNSPILLTEASGWLPATPPSPGAAPGTGRFLADLDLAASHDGRAASSGDPFFRSLGTADGLFTPTVAMSYADQILLYCRWYQNDCFQEGLA